MHRHLKRRHVVVGPDLRWQFQQTHEHGRHPLAVGDALSFDQSQRLLGIKAGHHPHGAAQLDHRHAVPQRRGMVQRCGRQVATISSIAKQGLQQVDQHRALACGRLRHRPFDALGFARRARRIQHVQALRLIGNGQHGGTAHGFIPALIPGHALSQGEAPDMRRQQRAQRCANLLQIARDHQHLGRAIFDNVGDLFTVQSGADGGVVNTGAVHAKTRLQKLTLIGHQHRHMVAWPHATRTQDLRDLIGPGIQLSKADFLPGFTHLKGQSRRVGRLAIHRKKHGGPLGIF